MFQQLISRIFRARHYWRSVSFDEIAELYVSRLMTVFAANIVSTFAVIFLYKLGYSVAFIAAFFGIGYVFKIFFAVPAAQFAAYFGPKRGTLAANLLRIPTLVAFAFVPEYGMPAILWFGLFQHMSNTLYNICYTTNFSKVRSIEHTGREIGIMNIMEKVAKIISPLVGGMVATIFGPVVAIWVACVVFILAALPLFRSVEPTKVRSRLRLRGYPWRFSWRSITSQVAVGFDFDTSGLAWTLFIGVFVFAGLGEGVYAALGGLASLGVFVSMIAAWTFGMVIDRRKGDVLLTIGTVLKAVIHLFRPFATVPAGVVATNIAAETATSAYNMPFMRVIFDTADSSGYRITYLMYIEMALNFGAAAMCGVLVLLTMVTEPRHALELLFVVAAVVQLLLLLSRRQAR